MYLRSHAATKSATFGILCLLGSVLPFWCSYVAVLNS
ncbi:hypothetical protein [Paenibacillus typhae]